MKAKILIRYNGKFYRVAKTRMCSCKKNCDLYKKGVCGSNEDVLKLPCDAIADAFADATGTCPNACYKEVRT